VFFSIWANCGTKFARVFPLRKRREGEEGKGEERAFAFFLREIQTAEERGGEKREGKKEKEKGKGRVTVPSLLALFPISSTFRCSHVP